MEDAGGANIAFQWYYWSEVRPVRLRRVLVEAYYVRARDVPTRTYGRLSKGVSGWGRGLILRAATTDIYGWRPKGGNEG